MSGRPISELGVLMALPTLKALRPGELDARATSDDTDHSVAGRLSRFAGEDVLLLHRRSAPDPVAGVIDHLAIGPSGVFVILARHCRRGTVQVRARGGLFTPARDRLLVRGRDRSALVRLLVQQRTAVHDVLADADVPVLAVLCAVGAQLPWNRVPVVDGVTVRGVVDTCLMIRASGPYDAQARGTVRDALARAFPVSGGQPTSTGRASRTSTVTGSPSTVTVSGTSVQPPPLTR